MALIRIDLNFFDEGITNAIPIETESINLKPYLDVFTASFIFKIFLFFDLILGILILDRAVLKPYFSRKHQSYT